jgi:hypothetical protein
MNKTLALDLEGTLISNAVSAFPRSGLYDFLSFCREKFDRLVIFTSVPQATAIRIMGILAAEGSTPVWFADLDVFTCERHMQKDLGRIGHPGSVWLVDDQEAYILPGQRDQWVPIQEFMPPFVQEDYELARVREALLESLDGMEDVYLANQVIERNRSGEEGTATLAEGEARLGRAHLSAAEALADLPDTLSPEAGETFARVV